MATKKVFILGGYQSFAACYLTYHIGRVLEEKFGYEPVIVQLGNETPGSSSFDYPRHYGMIEFSKLPASVSTNDLFLPLAAFWEQSFGLTLKCRKLLYVQGANTFKVLDGFMDGYVSVSTFVRDTLRHLYAIDSPVIHPFIELSRLPPPLEWEQREPHNVVIFAKPPALADPLVNAFAGRLYRRHPGIRPAFRVIQRGVPHAELMALLASTRFVLALSPTEGFGLVPLEAMASGCAVVGFHGGGGQDYMTNDNSRTVGYPALDRLVDLFAEVYRNAPLAQALAAKGKTDAQHFTLNRFEAAWINYLNAFGA